MSDLEQKLSELGLERAVAVAVGTFDGVHLGHRRLLESLRAEAKKTALTSVAITFREQPRALINPSARVTYLATLDHRVELIREAGVDAVLPVMFDEDLRAQSAKEFLETLRQAANVRLLVVGPSARLGHDRLTSGQIAPAAEEHGVRVVEAEAAQLDGADVSSSAIRNALATGDVKLAARMLGRPYRLDGKVVTGDRRGRELGFPTANIQPSGPVAIPEDGIYATVVHADGQRRMAATSVGIRPTFGGGERTVEAYILDYQGDLYGQYVELEFMERLRDEQKFDSIQPLIEQMNRDVSETREMLSGAI